MNIDSLLSKVRWALAAAIIAISFGLIAWTRTATGITHRTAEYVLLSVVNLGSVLVPTVLVIDAVVHLLRGLKGIRAGRGRAAIRVVSSVLVCDALLFGIAFLSALTVLHFGG